MVEKTRQIYEAEQQGRGGAAVATDTVVPRSDPGWGHEDSADWGQHAAYRVAILTD